MGFFVTLVKFVFEDLWNHLNEGGPSPLVWTPITIPGCIRTVQPPLVELDSLLWQLLKDISRCWLTALCFWLNCIKEIKRYHTRLYGNHGQGCPIKGCLCICVSLCICLPEYSFGQCVSVCDCVHSPSSWSDANQICPPKKSMKTDLTNIFSNLHPFIHECLIHKCTPTFASYAMAQIWVHHSLSLLSVIKPPWQHIL